MIKAIGRFYKRVGMGIADARQQEGKMIHENFDYKSLQKRMQQQGADPYAVFKSVLDEKNRYIAALEKRIDALTADNIRLKAAWDSAYKQAMENGRKANQLQADIDEQIRFTTRTRP